MSFQTKELRTQASKLANEAQDMVRSGLDTTEKRHKFDVVMDASEKKLAEAVRIEREEARTTHVEELEQRDKFNALLTGPEKEYRNAFAGFLRRGLNNLEGADKRMLLERRTDDQTASMWGNVTGQPYTGTARTQGALFVPPPFHY